MISYIPGSAEVSNMDDLINRIIDILRDAERVSKKQTKENVVVLTDSQYKAIRRTLMCLKYQSFKSLQMIGEALDTLSDIEGDNGYEE